MATSVAGNTVKEDLVFGYDTGHGAASNHRGTRHSPGEPTVNLLPSGPATGTGDFTRQGAHVEGFSYTKATNYKGRADVHKIYCNPSGNAADPYADYGGQYHKSGGSAVGDVYALSFDFYVSKGTNTPSLQLAYANGYKSPTSSGAASLSAITDTSLGDGWTRRTTIATITIAGNTHWRFRLATSGNETEAYLDNFQIELKSHATPFVDGTRSATQSLIDLKEATTINIPNLSFDSTGQPEFDGTNDYIQNNSYTKHQQNTGTLEVVVRPTIVSGNRYVAGVGGTTTYGATRTIRINSGTFGIITYGSATQDWGGVATATANQYQHVVATWSGTSLQLYVNNVLYSATKTGVVSPLGTNLTVGRPPWSAGSYYAGSVDIFKQYSQVLSPQQVEQNYNVYKNRFNI